MAQQELGGLPPPPPANVAPANVPAPNAAGKILTDDQVTTMLHGVWRMNDGMGLLDVKFNADGTVQSFREWQTASNFHNVFVQTPVSSGTWRVQQGQLHVHITASTRWDRVNQQLRLAVRSISDKDFIFVDSLGRVGQAIRFR
jgi:hypothetical protein